MTSFIVAAIILAMLISFDGWSTQYLMSKGSTELNPISAYGYKQIGLPATLAVEFAAIVMLGFLSPWIVWAVVVIEGANCIRQYTLVRKA